MLDNARRQLVVVLLVILAAVLSLVFSYEDIRLGLDLRGGTMLTYEIDIEHAKREGLIPQNASQDEVSAIIRETVAIIRERIDPTGTLDAVVQERGERGILIELPYMTETDARSVENLIQELGRLELRMVVSDSYVSEDVNEDVSFTLSEEKAALQSWLDADDGANRKIVAEDATRIELFNRLTAEQGGSKSEFVRWYPARIEPSIENPSVWGRSDSWPPSRGIDSPTVPAFGAEEYNGGLVKEGLDHLVELYAVNMHEKYFKGEDLSPGAIRPSIDERVALPYRCRCYKPVPYILWQTQFERLYSNCQSQTVSHRSSVDLVHFHLNVRLLVSIPPFYWTKHPFPTEVVGVVGKPGSPG